MEQARLIAGLTRLVRDIGLAEELAQEALVTALSEWPRIGTPTNPGASLMATAKRRAIDGWRRNRMLARKHAEIVRELADERETSLADIEAAMDDDLGDELLSLIFTACHPILSPKARVAVGGANGPYTLLAALAACHATAHNMEQTDWEDGGTLRHPAGGHAVAGGRPQPGGGPQHGLWAEGRPEAPKRNRRGRGVAQLRSPAGGEGDFLFRASQLVKARAEFERAATLTRNRQEKVFLLKRAIACG